MNMTLKLLAGLILATTVATTTITPPTLPDLQVLTGDTVFVKSIINDKETMETIRLDCIVAPPPESYAGIASKQYLEYLLTDPQTTIGFLIHGKDNTHKTLASLYVDDVQDSVQELLVANGHAFVYKGINHTCSNYPNLISLETQARESKTGVWVSYHQKTIPYWIKSLLE